MLATPGGKPFDDPEWVFEIKWDGYRAIAETGQVRLYSRNGLDFSAAYPAVVKELTRIRKPAILDGELVAFNEHGLPDFQRMSLAAGEPDTHVVYYVFDLLSIDGKDICGLPLLERKKLLRKVIKGGAHVRYCDHVMGRGKEFFEQIRDRGMEGVIAKLAEGPYAKGIRSKVWLKVKNIRNQEVVIGGFTAPKNSRTSFGSLLLGVYEKGKFVYCGHTGTGFSNAALKALRLVMKPIERPTSPFTTEPHANDNPTWVEPRLVCNVEFTEWTRDGKLRHPSYKGLRPDQIAKRVKREVE
jgi:bifunctional non-homologous end joining protein LigD